MNEDIDVIRVEVNQERVDQRRSGRRLLGKTCGGHVKLTELWLGMGEVKILIVDCGCAGERRR